MMTTVAQKTISYKEIANVELLRPIRNDEQYEATLKEVEKFIYKEEPTETELAYLEMLCSIVEAYEKTAFPIYEKPTEPVEILKFLLEQNEMNGSDLGRLLGNRSTGGAILRRERELSKEHIKILCERFSVSADLFLSE